MIALFKKEGEGHPVMLMQPFAGGVFCWYQFASGLYLVVQHKVYHAGKNSTVKELIKKNVIFSIL